MKFTFNNSGKNGHLFIQEGKVVSAQVECEKELTTLQDYISPSKLITISSIEEALIKFGYANIEIVGNTFAKLIDSALEKANFYGSICVKHKDQLILRKGYGFSNVAIGEKNRSDTFFRWHGFSEIAATLIAYALEEKGAIDLSASLSKYFPAYCIKRPELASITLKMLLNQTSGLGKMTEHLTPIATPIPATVILQSIFKKPLLFKPGEMIDTNGANMFVLCEVIEKATLLPYREHVKKFQLNHLAFSDNFEIATLYNSQGKINKYDHASLQTGHSDLFGTTSEMLELLDKVKPHLERRDTAKQFNREGVSTLACGLSCDFLFGKRIFVREEENGALYYSPKDDLMFGVLTNKPITGEFSLRKLISLITTNQL